MRLTRRGQQEEESAAEAQALRTLAEHGDVPELPHRFAVRVLARLAALGLHSDARRQQWAALEGAALRVPRVTRRTRAATEAV
jgi:hypothetical protein